MPGVRISTRGATVAVGALGAGGKPMREAAEIIAADARDIAGRWSKRIPPSITVRVSPDGKSATITANTHEDAPMAYTFEAPDRRMVWHPVFARGLDRREWTWVPQVPRPFLAPAAERSASKAADVWGEGVVRGWARARGFR